MFEIWKKSGIVLGHAICILILLYCFADTIQLPNATTNPIENVKPEQTMDLTETATHSAMTIVTIAITPTPILMATETPTPSPTPTQTPVPTATVTPAPIVTEIPTDERTAVKNQVLQNIADGIYVNLENTKDNWWFHRKEKQVPSGTGEQFSMKEYQGFFRNKEVTEEDKVIYLTIDCGYGSSNTEVLLDIFQQQDIKVTFFITNYFMEEEPEYVRRMVAEGHAVGNHSVTHADLTELSDEEIYSEIIGCEEMFYKITGTQMDLYFRPPEGAYSKRTMQITEDLGYKTIFWSLAYRDFDLKNQPGKEYVLDHFATYHHNGAIPLMHNDSDSNMEAMSEVITFLKEQGYRFGTLDELK